MDSTRTFKYTYTPDSKKLFIDKEIGKNQNKIGIYFHIKFSPKTHIY